MLQPRAAALLLLGARQPLLSIDISCPPDLQLQSRHSGVRRPNDGTDRQTDGHCTVTQTLLCIL